MNTFGSTKSSDTTRRNIFGLFEDDYERETSVVSTITSTAKDLLGGVFEAASDLKQTIITAESKPESKTNGKFPSTGSIEDFNKHKAQIDQLQKQQTERDKAAHKRIFFQALKEDADRAQRAKDKLLFEEEINDIATNLPTEEKNRLLHYQASYKDRSIYQRAELRRKIIEQQNQAENQQKEASIPSPTKQPSAIEGAFEGRSGTQGSGSANLSAQAVG